MSNAADEKLFVLSALVSRQEVLSGGRVNNITSMILGMRRCATLDEAKGSFITSVQKDKPGFSIDEILSMEIEECPASRN